MTATAPETTSNPTSLVHPAFLVSAPFAFRTDVPNNAWMRDLPDDQRKADPDRSMAQFLELYRALSGDALVYVLPTPSGGGMQDLVFTANLGIVLEHLPEQNTVVVSRFSEPTRGAETAVGVQFFEAMGYRVHVCPHHFEGEAELKHLRDNVYVGGYGTRSARESYEWMEREFDMEIVPLRMNDPYLYHLDCSVFPLTREQTLVCTEQYSATELRALEKHTEVVPVTTDAAMSGICNTVRLHNTLLNASNIHELKAGSEDYEHELAKNRALEDIAARTGFEVCLFNLDEYTKAGALLSCMVMHLNRRSYDYALF